MAPKVEKKKINVKLLAFCFVAVMAVCICGILASMMLIPYDPGTLSPAGLSSNLIYGGAVAGTDDYVFFSSAGGLGRVSNEDGSTETVYSGSAEYINPLDGWVYFVDGVRIMRTPYYGTISEQISDVSDVVSMSLNGSWIYYTDASGRLFKMRSDGEKITCLVDEESPVAAFVADNRIVVYKNDRGLFCISTDGRDKKTLVEGEIGHFCYTLDDLYYEQNGAIRKYPSVVSGIDVGLEYTPIESGIFCFNTDSSGRGQIFWYSGTHLMRTLLQSEKERSEQTETLCEVTDITDIYSILGDLYYHDSSDNLFKVTVNGTDSRITAVSK